MQKRKWLLGQKTKDASQNESFNFFLDESNIIYHITISEVLGITLFYINLIIILINY